MRWFVVALSVVVLVTHGLEGSPVKKSGDAAGAEMSDKQKRKLLIDVMEQLRTVGPKKKQLQLADCDYECETNYTYYSSCIPQDWVCDGAEDCNNGEDELHCRGAEPSSNHPPPIPGGPDTAVSPGPESIRLVGGSSDSEGRVEVFHDGQWGTVCDDLFDLYDAIVVCRQLGYLGASAAPGSAAFGPGSGQIWLDDVACRGSETIIGDCGHNGGWGTHNCGHDEDVGVVCADHFIPPDCFNCSIEPSIYHCIPDFYVCNGYPDCEDDSDEQDCEAGSGHDGGPLPEPGGNPEPPAFPEPGGNPEPPAFPEHGGDPEPNEDPADPSMLAYHPDNCTFLCDNDMNGYCIPDYWECDDFPDCRDGSDELHCDGFGGHHAICEQMDLMGPEKDVPVFVALLGSVSSLPMSDLMAMLNGSQHGGGAFPDDADMHDEFPEPRQLDLDHPSYMFHNWDNWEFGRPYKYIAKKSAQAKKSAILAAKELKTAAAEKKVELQQLLREGAPRGQPNGEVVLAHAQKQARKWFNSKVRSVVSMVKTYNHAARDLANLKQKAEASKI